MWSVVLSWKQPAILAGVRRCACFLFLFFFLADYFVGQAGVQSAPVVWTIVVGFFLSVPLLISCRATDVRACWC